MTPDTPMKISSWHPLDTIIPCVLMLTPSWHHPDTAHRHDNILSPRPGTPLTRSLHYHLLTPPGTVLTSSSHHPDILTTSWHLDNILTPTWHYPDNNLTHLKISLLSLNKCYMKWHLLAGNGSNSCVNIFYMLIMDFPDCGIYTHFQLRF